MKYLDAWWHLPDPMCHPMQRFVRHGDAVRYEELRAWTLRDSGLEFELFYVEGDRRRYEAALADVESVREYAIAPIDEDAFHVYARQETRPETTRWREAFADRELIVVPPVRFDERGAMGITVVGDGEDIQRTLAAVPDEIEVTVVEIGTYDRRGSSPAGALTDRQREALSVALEAGYYDVPRGADLAAVADELDVAEGSASVLLRRAERTVISGLLERYGSSGPR